MITLSKIVTYCIAAMLGVLIVKSCEVDYKSEIDKLKDKLANRNSRIKNLEKKTKILIKTIKKIEDDYKINDSIIINNSDSDNRELLTRYLSMP